MNNPRIPIVVSDYHSQLIGKEWLASKAGARNVQDEPGHLLYKKKKKTKEALPKIIRVIYKSDGIVLISLNIVYIFVNSPFLKVLSNTSVCATSITPRLQSSLFGKVAIKEKN